jgi:hypothetical protein
MHKVAYRMAEVATHATTAIGWMATGEMAEGCPDDTGGP